MHQVTPDDRLRSADKEHQEKMASLKQAIIKILDEDKPLPLTRDGGFIHKDDQLFRIRKLVE